MNKSWHLKTFIIIFCISIFGLMYIFPVLGDDLLHGSFGNGIFFMEDVNGRYLGNFFGINLSSNILLRTTLKSIVLIFIIYLLYKLTNENKSTKNLLLISILLILLMPKEMFRQIIVNTSGFCNYVFPILGILLILLYHFKYLNKNSSKIFFVLLLLLGINNSLFVEHITLYNIFLCIYLIGYSLYNKKNRLLYLSYTIGSVFGCFLMFKNPIYLSSFSGTDSYRNITPIKELISKFCEIVDTAFYQNLLIVLLLSIISLIIVKNFKNQKFNLLYKFITIFNCIYLSFYIINLINPNWYLLNSSTLHYYIKIILTVLFYINLILLTVISNFYKSEKHFLIIILTSFLITMAPLLFVNPIGPRCYFAGYIFITLFILKIIDIMYSKKLIETKLLNVFAVCAIVVTIFFYYNIYITIYNASEKRINNIKNQLLLGKTEVDFPPLPYSEYLHGAEVCPEYNITVYKLYYNIDQNINFTSEGC